MSLKDYKLWTGTSAKRAIIFTSPKVATHRAELPQTHHSETFQVDGCVPSAVPTRANLKKRDN